MAYCTQSDIENMLEQEILSDLTNDTDVLASSNLNGAITSSSTSIIIDDSSEFPSSGRVRINNEDIDYAANSLNTLSSLTRGVNNTVADAHDNDSVIEQILAPNSTVITRAIADADSKIDGYCSTRYDSLPFSTVPTLIRNISVDLSIYYLFSRRRRIDDDILRKYNEAVKLLEMIATGKLELDDANSIEGTFIKVNTYVEDLEFTLGSYTENTSGTLDNFSAK